MRKPQRHLVNAVVRKRLVDEASKRYIAWREEAADVTRAYACWLSAPPAKGELSFAAYSAAVDREERAAAIYGDAIEHLNRVVGADAHTSRPAYAATG